MFLASYQKKNKKKNFCIANPDTVEEHSSNIKRSVQQISHMFPRQESSLVNT